MKDLHTLKDNNIDVNSIKFLYKRTTTGAIQVWGQNLVNDKYRSIIGQIDGKLQVSDWTNVESKNIGKKNERLADDQAKYEVDNAYIKKKKEGYFESIDDIDNTTFIKPMLAYDWKDYKDKIAKEKEPQVIFLSSKMDGCLSKNTLVETELGTRTLEEVYNGKDKIVLSFNINTNKKEMSNILGKFKNAEDISNPVVKWIKITLENGESIKLTTNHPVFLPNLNVWRRAEDLKESDFLLVSTI